MHGITDYHFYRYEMAKGLQEKLFFLEHIPVDVLLDYGCADGALIEGLSHISNIACLGYDMDPGMIEFANHKHLPHALFSSNLKALTQSVQTLKDANTVLLCSSLIHEVYSYGTPESIAAFWTYVFSGTFKYVVIRDMALSKDIRHQLCAKDDLQKLFQHANPVQLREFVDIWGPISNQEQLLHFLMKYRYTQNWTREVRENYFPVTMEDYEALIPPHYQVLFKEHSALPFLQQQVQLDFGIFLPNRTHLKLILKRPE